jgi:quinolinate synthase
VSGTTSTGTPGKLASETRYDAMLAGLRRLLGQTLPDAEIQLKAELAVQINALKREKNAIILGHNYMEPAIYLAVADITGDSLELCRKAAETSASVMVFCGVEFMAETAKILNPRAKVLIPSLKAGCSLASSIKAEDVRVLRKRYPGVPIVAYINTYADVKAEIDVCCTSGNAKRVVESLDSDTVIFIPDEYLAKNIARETGRKVIFPEAALPPAQRAGKSADQAVDKVFIGWHGKCEVHEKFTVQDIKDVRAQFPDVVVLAHPECPPDVVEAADFSGSTSAMIRYVKEVDAPRYLLLTECAMGDNIIAENPGREVLRMCSVRCPHMNQITLEDTLESLKQLRYEVTVPADVAERAKRSIDRMLAIP